MLVTADKFSTLLQALGLSQVLFKPVPPSQPSGITAKTINIVQAQNIPTANGSINIYSPVNIPPLLVDTINIRKLKQRDVSCQVDPYNPPSIGDQTFAPFDQTQATVFRYRQQQSVNLGSW